jgi:hypothetical protein
MGNGANDVPLNVGFRLHRQAFEELTTEASRWGFKNWHERVVPGTPAGLSVRRWVGAFYVSEAYPDGVLVYSPTLSQERGFLRNPPGTKSGDWSNRLTEDWQAFWWTD